MKTFKQDLKETSMWDWIYKKNNGVFYRGVGRCDKDYRPDDGVGVLGKGVYLTWEEGMARAFSKRQGAGGEVKKYKLKRGLKIVDAEADKYFAEAKAVMIESVSVGATASVEVSSESKTPTNLNASVEVSSESKTPTNSNASAQQTTACNIRWNPKLLYHFAGMLTMLLKKKKYAGAVSDDIATGICIFDERNIKEIK